MALNRKNNWMQQAAVIGAMASGTEALSILNAAYVNQTSGPAGCVAIVPEQDGTIVDVWVYTKTFVGTMVSGIKAELRALDTSNGRPSTLIATSNTVLCTANNWCKLTFSSSNSLTKGNVYWVVIQNADASPTSNYCSICHTGNVDGLTLRPANFFRSAGTTDGFTSGPTFSTGSGVPGILVRFVMGGESIYRGCPYNGTLSNGPTSVNDRGNVFTVDENCYINGFCGDRLLANTGTFKLFRGSALASSTPLVSATFGNTYMANNYQAIGCEPTLLYAGESYRVVFVPGSSSASCYLASIPGTPDADIRACRPWGGTCYATDWNGSAWVDQVDKIYTVAALVTNMAKVARRFRAR